MVRNRAIVISDKVFNSGLSKFCGRQFCLSRPYPLKYFKGCLPQYLLGPFLNTLSLINWKMLLLLRTPAISDLRAPFYLMIFVPNLKFPFLLLASNLFHCQIIFLPWKNVSKTFLLHGLKRIWKLKLVITWVTFGNSSLWEKIANLLA